MSKNLQKSNKEKKKPKQEKPKIVSAAPFGEKFLNAKTPTKKR